jgi:hypothetical protein
MAMGIASACVNHPSIEATGRCKQCSRPFCSACAVQGATGQFCSNACKEKHESFVQRAAKLDDMQRDTSFFAKIWIRIRKLLAFLIVALILAVAVHFMGVHVPWLSDTLNQYL